MGKPEDLEDRLAGMQGEWEKAKAFNQGELPEDGTYQALIQRFDFFESKKGELFLKTELQIQLDEKYEGHPVEIIHNLSDPDRLDWLKQHLHNCGLDLENFAELDGRLHELLDVPVEIAVKTSKKTDNNGNPYRNAYVNQRLGNPMPGAGATDVPADPDPVPAGASAGQSDDDIPF